MRFFSKNHNNLAFNTSKNSNNALDYQFRAALVLSHA